MSHLLKGKLCLINTFAFKNVFNLLDTSRSSSRAARVCAFVYHMHLRFDVTLFRMRMSIACLILGYRDGVGLGGVGRGGIRLGCCGVGCGGVGWMGYS